MICLTTRYCPSAAGGIEFLSFSPATGLQKLNFRVADHSGVESNPWHRAVRTIITRIDAPFFWRETRAV